MRLQGRLAWAGGLIRHFVTLKMKAVSLDSTYLVMIVSGSGSNIIRVLQSQEDAGFATPEGNADAD